MDNTIDLLNNALKEAKNKLDNSISVRQKSFLLGKIQGIQYALELAEIDKQEQDVRELLQNK